MRTLSLLGAAISLGFAAGVSAYVPTIGREATIGEDLKFNLTPIEYSAGLTSPMY